jgi:multidrug efflux system membrane fusion protein
MTTKTTPTDLKDFPEVHRSVVPEPPLQKPPAEKSKKRGIIWAVFLVAIAGVTAYAVWRAGQPNAFIQPNQQGKGKGKGGRGAGLGPVPVVTAKVKKADVPVYLDGLGNVVAFYTVTVKSRVDGQLMKVNFNEGDLVKEGQVLMEIDPRPYQVQLDLAEGTLAHDQALMENARLDLERYKTLLAQDAVPKQQLDTQVALVAQYVGNIKQDQANIDSAKLNLTYAKVTAPSGIAAGRSRQYRPRFRPKRHDRDYPASADPGTIHNPRRQPASGHEEVACRGTFGSRRV